MYLRADQVLYHEGAGERLVELLPALVPTLAPPLLERIEFALAPNALAIDAVQPKVKSTWLQRNYIATGTPFCRALPQTAIDILVSSDASTVSHISVIDNSIIVCGGKTGPLSFPIIWNNFILLLFYYLLLF